MDDRAAVHEALRTVQQFAHWLDLCGCGDGPAAVLVEIRRALGWFGDDGRLRLDRSVDRSQDFWLYLLDAWKLTEHGGSVYGSWLTPAGGRLRDALALVDLDTYAEDTDGDGSWWLEERRRRPAGAVLTFGVWRPDGPA